MSAAFFLLLVAVGTVVVPLGKRLVRRGASGGARLGALAAWVLLASLLGASQLALGWVRLTVGVVGAVFVWNLGSVAGDRPRSAVARGNGALKEPTRPDPLRVVAAAALTVAVAGGLLVFSPDTGAPAAEGRLLGWYAALGGSRPSLAAVLACLGLVILLGVPTNAVVSAVLVWSGRDAPQRTSSGRASAIVRPPALRGGRIIGPMERWLILALAGAGVHAAIAALIAAKGVIRFPEVSQDTSGARAEEFLIGSLSSWSLACVAALMLAAL
ncbi:hypothetical protein [Actinomyces oricola]|uniref:hypothetical protein n=1 Tax=Actinomyces oricola TaxID=206043 RepID=UPI000FFF2676|nr:hypothetical protein [Actinomyces oricola]